MESLYLANIGADAPLMSIGGPTAVKVPLLFCVLFVYAHPGGPVYQVPITIVSDHFCIGHCFDPIVADAIPVTGTVCTPSFHHWHTLSVIICY